MKVGRNQLCSCGSGKKYKKCCLDKPSSGKQLQIKGKNAEDFVYELAKKSFLEDWCYKNPIFPDGKELCDLLIVYDEIAIIWQIKNLKLDNEDKYKNSEVEKNLRQLYGAKRRLFELKQSITLENPRRGKEIFDSMKIRETYLISALLGRGEDFFSFAEIKKESAIHTFTREFTEIILNELDTVSDFVDYLKEKQKLIAKDNSITLIGGEEELLAYYLMNQRNFNKLSSYNTLIIEDSFWDELQKRPEYIAKKKEDKISYGWDKIINRAHTSGLNYEKIAKELARPSRFERRILSKAFFDAHIIAHNTNKNTFRRIIKSNGTTYCFVFLDDVEPRDNRRALLGNVCFIARGIHKENTKVIGIATEMKIAPICSYDFCLLELPEWTKKEQLKMEKVQEETGILTQVDYKHMHEDEYPAQ